MSVHPLKPYLFYFASAIYFSEGYADIKPDYKNGVTLWVGQSDNTSFSGVKKTAGKLGKQIS